VELSPQQAAVELSPQQAAVELSPQQAAVELSPQSDDDCPDGSERGLFKNTSLLNSGYALQKTLN
jgi:hypothetical protein